MKDDSYLFHEIIDETIKIDKSILPEEVVERINELEELHAKKDWFFYDLKFDQLEVRAKTYINSGGISVSLYNKLLEKYGGLYD